jgi:hypothetical protein
MQTTQRSEIMDDDDLPPSDLARLRDEVLSKPPEAALPCQLSDYWLRLICRDLDVWAGESDVHLNTPNAAPLALVLHVMSSRAAALGVAITVQDLQRCLNDYRMEVALELVRRSTNIKPEPATLETIFTERCVAVRQG